MNETPALPVNWLNEELAVAPQLTELDMMQAFALGFRSIINNRPDFEAGPMQPTTEALQAAARAAGLAYAYVPVPSASYTPADALKMRDALLHLPKPMLAFCRSGARSTRLIIAAMSLDK